MPRYLLLMLISLVTFNAFSKQKTEKYANISCNATVCNFGNFSKLKPIHVAKFTITNSGNMPLIISNVDVQCGCTSVNYSKKPLKPGASTTVYVRYNGTNMHPGHFHKGVIIKSNAKESLFYLYISGNMTD